MRIKIFPFFLLRPDSLPYTDLDPAVVARRRAAAEKEGWSCCLRCGRSWKFSGQHHTPYSEHEGCFPLCEDCWAGLHPDERLPFYVELWFIWCAGNRETIHNGRSYGEVWDDMEIAVLEGL